MIPVYNVLIIPFNRHSLCLLYRLTGKHMTACPHAFFTLLSPQTRNTFKNISCVQCHLSPAYSTILPPVALLQCMLTRNHIVTCPHAFFTLLSPQTRNTFKNISSVQCHQSPAYSTILPPVALLQCTLTRNHIVTCLHAFFCPRLLTSIAREEKYFKTITCVQCHLSRAYISIIPRRSAIVHAHMQTYRQMSACFFLP